MDWNLAERLLTRMADAYTIDNIRKITFNHEIFPVWLRFTNGDRSAELYARIVALYEQLGRYILPA